MTDSTQELSFFQCSTLRCSSREETLNWLVLLMFKLVRTKKPELNIELFFSALTSSLMRIRLTRYLTDRLGSWQSRTTCLDLFLWYGHRKALKTRLMNLTKKRFSLWAVKTTTNCKMSVKVKARVSLKMKRRVSTMSLLTHWLNLAVSILFLLRRQRRSKLTLKAKLNICLTLSRKSKTVLSN